MTSRRESSRGSLAIKPSESPVWVQFLPCRLLVTIPYALEGKSASSQLPNRGVHLHSWAIYLALQQSLPAEHGLCAGTPGGHSSVCTTVKVIGMHRPVHYDLKDIGSLTWDQSSSCVEVISCEMHAWIYTLP